ncbi:hypothetical protein AB6Q56_15845 [Dechloromonas sp. ARDL1]|uniref:hypothetical protein n=1 Tax=Dechloromonas sp. ARDL1 TaxID=3322121 RepID=UPI003DA72E38
MIAFDNPVSLQHHPAVVVAQQFWLATDSKRQNATHTPIAMSYWLADIHGLK